MLIDHGATFITSIWITWHFNHCYIVFYGFIKGQLYEINYCFEINFRWCIYHGLVTALLEYDEYDLCILCQDETKSNDSIQIPSPQSS